MAEYRDVATNKDILEIANAIRRIAQLSRKLTIPEMIQVLETIPRNAGLMFTNVEASDWVSSNNSSDYSYKCELNLEGIKEDSVVLVIYDEEQSESGDYAHVCEVAKDKVVLFSNRNDVIVIPVIKEVY